MRRTLILIAALLVTAPLPALAAGPAAPLQKANNDLGDTNSLQRGARVFVNYCMGCHSANYMRYSRLIQDLKLPEEVLKQNLMFGTDKITDTMQIAMRPQDSATWFGVAPPDLSVVARSRGTDWLYTYLLSYYADPARPTGVNNLVFENTAMPHVLWELQGLQRKADSGGEQGGPATLEVMAPGKLSTEEYSETVRDLVNFLEYMGEPAKLVRYKIGVYVMLFLAFFSIVAYLMKKEYWKDIH